MQGIEAGTQQWLNLIKDVSAAVVSLSLLLGVSWLSGICGALGVHAFGYVNATDIARSALAICPLLVLYMAGVHMVRLAVPAVAVFDPTPHPGGVPAQKRVLRRTVVVALGLMVPMHLFLTEADRMIVLPFLLLLVVLTLADYSYELRVRGAIGAVGRLIALVAISCMLIAGFGYLSTSVKLLTKKTNPQQQVCIQSGCRDGTIISRFSEATFVQWGGAADIVVLPNTEIRSVTLRRNFNEPPLIELGPKLSAAWQWLSAFGSK